MQFIGWIQDANTFHMKEEISVKRYNTSKNISPRTLNPLVIDTTSDNSPFQCLLEGV